MQSIYLSLNQGTDSEKRSTSEKRDRMKKNAEIIRQGFESSITDGFLNEIRLNSSLTRPKNYEAGNIIAIRYQANSLPSEDTLVSDLNMMLWIYLNALRIPTPFATGGALRNNGLGSIEPLSANEIVCGFNPKPDSPVMVQIFESTMIRNRLHETLVREFGEHAISLGFRATTPHPHDIELIKNGSTWIVEAKIIYNNGIKDAVRAAIGQLFCYRFDAPKKQVLALFNKPVDKRGVELLLSLGISIIYKEDTNWRVFSAQESDELLELDKSVN
jgi:hypothetical protein